MRRLAAAPSRVLLASCVLLAGPAAARTGQDSGQDSQPSGQTLLKNLMGGKNQTSAFGSHARSETREQREHYTRRTPDDHSSGGSTVNKNQD